MPNRLDIPLSGLRAAQARQAASAHDVANLNTDGFTRQRTAAAEAPSGGVETRADTVTLSEQARNAAQQVDGPQNNVDPAEEAVTQIEARSAATTNVRVLQVEDRLGGTLLDLLA